MTPGNVKVLLKMYDLKSLHALWIVESYDHLKQHESLILSRFHKAGITDIFKSVNEVFARIENLLTAKRAM